MAWDGTQDPDPANASAWGGHGKSSTGTVIPFAVPGKEPPLNDADAEQLRNLLCVHTWASLEVPEEPKLLGDMITRRVAEGSSTPPPSQNRT
jgi:hypothetical protein